MCLVVTKQKDPTQGSLFERSPSLVFLVQISIVPFILFLTLHCSLDKPHGSTDKNNAQVFTTPWGNMQAENVLLAGGGHDVDHAYQEWIARTLRRIEQKPSCVNETPEPDGTLDIGVITTNHERVKERRSSGKRLGEVLHELAEDVLREAASSLRVHTHVFDLNEPSEANSKTFLSAIQDKLDIIFFRGGNQARYLRYLGPKKALAGASKL